VVEPGAEVLDLQTTDKFALEVQFGERSTLGINIAEYLSMRQLILSVFGMSILYEMSVAMASKIVRLSLFMDCFLESSSEEEGGGEEEGEEEEEEEEAPVIIPPTHLVTEVLCRKVRYCLRSADY
jgi:hypothetical protein